MKHIFLLLSMMHLLGGLNAQNTVGIGTTNPAASAQLHVNSTTKGFLPPRMTTTERNAISSPAKGLLVYDININSLFHYNGSAWANLSAGGGVAVPKVAFGMSGVHGSHLAVPDNAARRVQYTGPDLYDLTQSYTPLVNNYDPATSSTFLVPISGVYHLDLGLQLTSAFGLDFDEASGVLSLYRNRNGNVTLIASNISGEKDVRNPTYSIFFTISRDFSLLAGDRIYAQIFQTNADDKTFTIRQSESYFTGHLLFPL